MVAKRPVCADRERTHEKKKGTRKRRLIIPLHLIKGIAMLKAAV